MEEIEELVSIGMPVYNDKSFLPLALESLLNQSYRHFELILSDDCSTDGSAEICKEAEKWDTRIRYIRQPSNIGISRNMKFLLNQAKGKYFMWAANDDLWHPDFIKELVRGLQNRADSVAAFCAVKEIDEKGNEIQTLSAESIDYSGKHPEIRLKKLIRRFYDGFGYGLFVRDQITNVRFPVWWGINRNSPYNNIYPSLCFYLTRGNYVSCGEIPMWYNRMKSEENIHHKIPFPNHFIRGYFAFLLRKFNLVIFSLKEIRRAGGSFLLIAQITPSMFYHWFLKPGYYGFLTDAKRLLRGKISFW